MDILIMILVIIGAIFGIPASIATILGYLKIEPDEAMKFVTFLGRRIARITYILIALFITIYFVVVAILLPTLIPFSISTATIFTLFILGLIGVWSPEIQRLRKERLNKAANGAMIVLITLAIVGFWIIKWPAWQIPALLAGLWIITLVYYLIDKFFLKRKHQNGYAD